MVAACFRFARLSHQSHGSQKRLKAKAASSGTRKWVRENGLKELNEFIIVAHSRHAV
jgi:hypothetical protein